MTKRILLSLGSIAFMGALAAGATGAFFTDSETSTGNVFTAGSIVLTVDDTQHYNNAVCTNIGSADVPNYVWRLAPNQTAQPDQYPVIGSPCDGTWLPSPLGAHKFWNFNDVKPGDNGENTISLHVATNPAWACMNINVTGNPENGVNGPEVAAGDNPALNGPFDGELAQNLQYVVWQDNGAGQGVAGDNIHQTGEPIVVPITTFATGPITGPVSKTVPLADSTTGTGPLATSTTNFLGVDWCLGTLTMNVNGSFACDGSSPSLNIVQTDGMTADVTLNVVQSRNNGNFVCAPSTAPQTGGIVVIKNVAGTTTVPASAFSLHVLNSSNVDVAGSPQPGSTVGTPYFSLAPGSYSIGDGSIVVNGDDFSASFSGACGVSGSLTVTAGATSTCTVTNTDTGPAPKG